MKKITLLLLFLAFNAFGQHNEERLVKFRNMTTIDSNDETVFNLLQELYSQILQSDSGELDPSMGKKTNKLYQSEKTKNRHLLILFMAYQSHITETAAAGKKPNTGLQLGLSADLTYEFKNIYNKIPAIVYIYRYEALDSGGQKEEAVKVIEEGLSAYPDSVPLKIYKYLNSKDQALKEDLFLHHHNHWMVKQFMMR
ncbi:hypothetical protein NAT51_14970 [Flavobacterium amniphilum]|uniref:hypothetical protein n=1 Tax=Flavobacterium amniphilum TaxID=1834035 RepID=UPI002029BD8F|nr:hypothetical protein [Flavobacterium amniphilum]MCL9806835.1 hypothetical protein [Flavobacterium amniphilum]